MNYYTFRVQLMHAILACMVLAVLAVGSILGLLPHNIQATAYLLHKSFGICIFFLMLLRLYFIYRDGRIALPAHSPRFERILSRIVQYSLYLILILMPLSGWLMSCASDHIPSFFGLFSLPCPGLGKNTELAKLMSGFHYFFAWLIAGLLGLHVMGGLKHYFWDKDNVLQSMWSFKRK
jgi:cytochrome b561